MKLLHKERDVDERTFEAVINITLSIPMEFYSSPLYDERELATIMGLKLLDLLKEPDTITPPEDPVANNVVKFRVRDEYSWHTPKKQK